MNIHYPQVEKKSQAASYLLAALAVSIALMMTLSLSRQIELDLSVPSISMQATQIQNSDLPVAISVPVPPAEQAQPIATPEPTGAVPVISVPQVIAAPMPSVP